MNAAKPDMWGPTRFKYETTPPVVRKSLKGIDRQLALWDAAKNNSAYESRFYLGTVIGACQDWLAAKGGKMQNHPTKNVLARAAKVRELKRMAFERLRWEAFEERKQSGVKPVAKPIGAGYAAERSQFLAGKRAGMSTAGGGEFNPAGGSFVKESMGTVHDSPAGQQALADGSIPGNIVALLNTPFESLSEQQFLTLHAFFTSSAGDIFGASQTPYIHFARKDERIESNMLVAINGVFYRNTGDTPYSTAGMDIYAMDRYGNLMVQKSNRYHDGMQYNHSSLNAGNDVICAGTLVIRNGLIHEIDNDSGHYKPGRPQVNGMLKVLVDDDRTNLAFATLRLKSASAADQFFRGNAIRSLYANWNSVGTAT